MRKFLIFFFVIISSLSRANAADNAMVIHCKYVGDIDCEIENKPPKITGNHDCNLIPQAFANDTVLYISRTATGDDYACSRELRRVTHNTNNPCLQIRSFYQDDAKNIVLFCETNSDISLSYDEGDPAQFSYAHKQCIGSKGIWTNGACDCSALTGTTLVDNECLCTDNPKQKYYNPLLTGCNTLVEGAELVWRNAPVYMISNDEEGIAKYDRSNSCDISGGNYEGTLGDPRLPNTCDCTRAPNMQLDPTGYFCECIEGYNYRDPTSKVLGCIPISEIDFNAPDISEGTVASTATEILEGASVIEEHAEESSEETDQSQVDINSITKQVTNSLSKSDGSSKTQKNNDNLKEAEDKYKKAKENEQSLKNRTLTAATTAATGIGMMKAAAAMSEQKADETAEQDMTAYLATFRCEYGKGQSAKAGNEEITLPGGNDLLKYYTEYKSLADKLKVTKKALGLRPGIEEEVLYDRAESGLYQYSSVGKTDGAYTSLSRALTDTEGKDADAWKTQKEKTAKDLKTGLIAAGAGIVGGIAGDMAINGFDNKDENSKKDSASNTGTRKNNTDNNYQYLQVSKATKDTDCTLSNAIFRDGLYLSGSDANCSDELRTENCQISLELTSDGECLGKDSEDEAKQQQYKECVRCTPILNRASECQRELDDWCNKHGIDRRQKINTALRQRRSSN